MTPNWVEKTLYYQKNRPNGCLADPQVSRHLTYSTTTMFISHGFMMFSENSSAKRANPGHIAFVFFFLNYLTDLVGVFNPSEKYQLGLLFHIIRWENKYCSKPPTSDFFLIFPVMGHNAGEASSPETITCQTGCQHLPSLQCPSGSRVAGEILYQLI